MIELQIEVSIPEVTEKDLGEAHKAAGTAAMKWFAETRLKYRFDGRMARELQFDERKEGYNNAKRFFGSMNVPHRFKGDTRQQVLGGGTRIIASPRATVKTARLILRNLNPGYKRRPEPNRPNMASELKRISSAEARQMATIYRDVYGETIQQLLNKPKSKRRVKG
jgi:hypothetical protein